MPYGRYTRYRGTHTRRTRFVARGQTARRTAVAKSRAGGNRKVAAIQSRAYVPRKVKTTSSIFALAKQVKALQRSQIGLYQKAYQKTYVNMSPSAANRGLVNRVAFIPLNDFTYGSGFRQSYTDTSEQPQYVAFGQPFASFEPLAGLTNNRYNYWVNCNDTVSSVAYLPIRCTINMQFELKNMKPNSDPLWIRYMIIKQKKQLLSTTAHALNLPQNMNALCGMARDNRDRNRINKEYFSVITDKWIKFSNTNDVMKDVHVVRSVSMKFPSKLLTVDKEFPVTDNDPNITAQVNQTFTSNIEPTDVYYLCIHTSRECNNHVSPDPEVLYLQANRFISWRDQHGAAS